MKAHPDSAADVGMNHFGLLSSSVFNEVNLSDKLFVEPFKGILKLTDRVGISIRVIREKTLEDLLTVKPIDQPSRGQLDIAVNLALGYLPHSEIKGGLLMVAPLGLVVKHPTHVHHDVTLTEDLRVPGPHNFGITILRQHLEEDASEDFVTVKGAVMCSNPDPSLELVTDPSS